MLLVRLNQPKIYETIAYSQYVGLLIIRRRNLHSGKGLQLGLQVRASNGCEKSGQLAANKALFQLQGCHSRPGGGNAVFVIP
jgi:hypothetical protein